MSIHTAVESRRSKYIFAAALALLASIYGGVLLTHTSWTAGMCDSSGYLLAARIIAGGATAVEHPSELTRFRLPDEKAPHFAPLGYSPGPRPGTIVPSYPPGVPTLMLIAAKIVGWDVGPFVIAPLAAVALSLMTALLMRALGFGHGYAFAGALIVALVPVIAFQATYPMSDVPAGLIAVVVLYFTARQPATAWSAAAIGATLAIAVAVRPTNALLAIPVAIGFPYTRKNVLTAGAVFMAFLAPLLAWQAQVYGGPLRTGYGSISYLLSVANVPPRAEHYRYWLSKQLTPLMLCGWLYLPFARRIAPRMRWMIFSSFAVIIGFYVFYEPYDAWWYTRFLIPGIPAIVIGGIALIRDLASLPKKRRIEVVAAILLIFFPLRSSFIMWKKYYVLNIADDEHRYLEAINMMRRHVRQGDLIVAMQASGALKYYTGVNSIRWSEADRDELLSAMKAAKEQHLHSYALLFDFELDGFKQKIGDAGWRKLDGARETTLFVADQ